MTASLQVSSEDLMEESLLYSEWIAEQHFIASQVKVLPSEIDTVALMTNNFETNNNNSTANGDRFIEKSLDDDLEDTLLIGGVDVSFPSVDSPDMLSVAAYVILQQSTMQVVYRDFEYFVPQVPYTSSFLAFREIEPLERLVKKQLGQFQNLTPAVIMVDGNGVYHPRRAGIACFLGVRTGIPTIGIGKTLLVEGGLTKQLVWSKMDSAVKAAAEIVAKSNIVHQDLQTTSILYDRHSITAETDERNNLSIVLSSTERDECIKTISHVYSGLAIPLVITNTETSTSMVVAALLVAHGGRACSIRKSTRGTKVPIFVSVGHNVSLMYALRLCAKLSIARIPEPVRQADLWGRELMRQRQQQQK